MPRKSGPLAIARQRQPDAEDDDLLDIGEELDAREVASLAINGQAGATQPRSLSSDDYLS